MYDASSPMLDEHSLRALEAQYCSYGDTVHYLPDPKFFTGCEGSFMYDARGREYLDLQMWYSAVNFGYRRHRANTTALMLITAAFGAIFVAMQAFEWTKLIVEENVRPWSNPMGAAQFGSSFFMITGFHGLHVSAGVVYLTVVALRVWRGFYDRKGSYETVEIAGLYWHFVDLVWVFIFALFYLW